jgi:hypothetical protein
VAVCAADTDEASNGALTVLLEETLSACEILMTARKSETEIRWYVVIVMPDEQNIRTNRDVVRDSECRVGRNCIMATDWTNQTRRSSVRTSDSVGGQTYQTCFDCDANLQIENKTMLRYVVIFPPRHDVTP